MGDNRLDFNFIVKQIPLSAREVCSILTKNKFESYLVGGCIRNILLEKRVYDFDFATNATPNELMSIFPKVIPTGIKHGTVTVIHRGFQFQVTTYRLDGRYSDRRRPNEVFFAPNIDKDLKRRDFTINALACNPLTGECLDQFGGIEDLKKKIIRTIGNPKDRFEEDALRMMRACRFTAELKFNLEDKTRKAIFELKEKINDISAERIKDEFIKIIESPNPSIGIECMRLTGLLEVLFPDIMRGFGVEQNKYHKHDVYYHTLHVLDAVENKDYRLRLSALFHDVAKPIVKKIPENKTKEDATFFNHEIVGASVAKKIMRQLKFSNEDVKIVTHLVKHHMFHYTSEWTDGAIRRFINRVQSENLDLLFQLRRADRIGNGYRKPDCDELEEFRKRIENIIIRDSAMKITDLDIDGRVIMGTFDIKPGKEIGKLLKNLLEKVLDKPELNEQQKLIDLSREYLESKQ